ncbi:hypothetical protein LT335_00157 [Spiroplasma sp. JKS002669]|uniref:hypothetical protein n=1 Tax=Spiroplasma attinicola TaxID=2904537 RepID=UPI0020BFA5FF|nr:hypothetical protein [Spiroplasma sp. JKS002669]MCL6428618.1 hypothetical protein [Spiroplasma sp. JKS002669]
MKRKIIISTAILSLLTIPLLVTACGINSNIKHDNYQPGNDDIVNLSDCNNLFTNDDLTYSYLTITKEKVALNILSILKYNIKSVTQNDYLITFTTKNGNPVININMVNNYNIILTASQDSKYLQGNLTLNLSVIDDRTDISKINYDENNWYLSSRNTIADLLTKFEMAIYLTIKDSRYHLGDFLKIIIQHQDKIYTNADENNHEVLDINSSYIISATAENQNIANGFIIGTAKLTIFASDERQTVANLSNQIFDNYHPDNLIDNGKTLYSNIRDIINNLYTLDATTQSDFNLTIKDNNNILSNNQSKLTSLNYQIIVDATNSKYLKDINSNLTINIVDKVIHLDKLKIDTFVIRPSIATQAKTLKTDVLSQISIAASFPGIENYLIVNLTQNDAEIIDDNQYLDPTNVQVNVVADETMTTQYFGGKLDFNLFVIDNRIDLKDPTITSFINKAISRIGYSTLNNLAELKAAILTIIKEYSSDTDNQNINENITSDDLDITLDGYSNDSDSLSEATNISLTIKANNNSRYIKNELNPRNININYAKEKSSFANVSMTPIEFVDYDENNNPHIMTQINESKIAVYNQNLNTIKYKINYYKETTTILDYKISQDGEHDFWVIETKINDNHFQIDYYIDNNIVSTYTFEGYGVIAAINKYSQTLYVRPDISEEHDGIGNLYLMNSKQELTQVDLSLINSTPFKINLIRSSETTSQIYIQSDNKIYAINEDISAVEPIIEKYDISDNYFFDYDNQNNIYQLKIDGLYRNGELIKSTPPNPNLLYDISEYDHDYNYKFVNNFTVDNQENFYYLYRDTANNRYSVVKNQAIIFSITDPNSLNQYLKVLPNGTWELTIGSKIYTNEK